MDNLTLKRNAKSIMANPEKPSAITAGLLYVVITLVLEALSAKLTGIELTDTQYEKWMDMYTTGQFEAALTYIQKFMPSTGAFGIDSLIRLLKMIIDGGFLIFILNHTRKSKEACYGNILDGFEIPFKLIFLNILKALVIGIGLVFLVVPGVIAAYGYRQSTFLLLDHKDWGIMKCLKESRRIMKGYKWKAFTLDLSLLGWYFLSAIPLTEIYAYPLVETTKTLFYDSINGRIPDAEFTDYTEI